VVLQLNSAGAEKWRVALAAALLQATGCARIFERSDSDVRGLEGLEPRTGWLHGASPTGVVIEEHGMRWRWTSRRPQDRLLPRPAREPPARARDRRDRSVLNCFCYTGGFSLQALAGGAREVLSIDSSGPALESARRNLALNPQLAAARAEWRDADVFEELRALKKAGARFDLIILDPPKFAPPRPTPSAPRAPTRTSTCSASACSIRAAC
jgi:23S rRNA (cytosine1962-C5)-methyltransferase